MLPEPLCIGSLNRNLSCFTIIFISYDSRIFLFGINELYWFANPRNGEHGDSGRVFTTRPNGQCMAMFEEAIHKGGVKN